MFDEHVFAVLIVVGIFLWAHGRSIDAKQKEEEIREERNKMYSEQEWFK